MSCYRNQVQAGWADLTGLGAQGDVNAEPSVLGHLCQGSCQFGTIELPNIHGSQDRENSRLQHKSRQCPAKLAVLS